MRQPGPRSPSSGAPRWFYGRIQSRDAPVLLRFLLLSQPSGGRDRLSSPNKSGKPPAQKPGGFFLPEAHALPMNPTYEPTTDKTSLTDDERIDNVIPLPPPEHLIRFFP